MATLYVGPGGNDTNNGLSWANRRLTLNGIEDKPVVAGDTVYVGPGAYRETLTVDVAGSSGSPITYIGDATGEHTDGVGGVVRITGSNNDQSAVRANCINMPNARSFRTFRGFQFDGNSGHHINLQPSSSNLIVEDCVFLPCTTGSSACVNLMGTGTGHIIRRCFLMNPGPGILATHTSTVNDTGMLWENCVAIIGGVAYAFRSERVGGITVKNCTVLAGEAGMRVNIALAAGQTMQVYNCVITGCNQALVATTLGTTPALAKKKHGSAHGIVVYRLSARGSSCRACKKHHRSFVFATHALAAANRAHPGCNCPITTQLLAKKKVRRLLPAGVGVVDLRKVEVKRRA